MVVKCSHGIQPYFDVFDMSEPTAIEVNRSRLYQCKDCGRWFSFLGHKKIDFPAPEVYSEAIECMTFHKRRKNVNKAVVVVDVQGDFTIWKNGSLAVPGTDEAYIKDVEEAIYDLRMNGYDIYGTQDWHPENHISFNTSHPGKDPFDTVKIYGNDVTLWPPHCIKDTENAKILIDNSVFKRIVQKGTFVGWDSYSGFYTADRRLGLVSLKTVLEGILKEAGVDELIVFGLATDICVKATAIDGVKLGFKVTIIKSLCRGVDPVTTEKALKEMSKAGVTIVDFLEVV